MKSVQRSQQRLTFMLAHWRAHHVREVKDSIKRMIASPVSSLLTLLVVAMSLALPASLYILLHDAEQVTTRWEGQARLSLYLQEGLAATQQSDLHKKLSQYAGIAEARLITPAEALDEFRTLSGYGQVLDLLESNPLPAVIVITPTDTTPDAVGHLRDELAKLPEVASADIDLAWVQRLAAILQLGRHLMLALAIALCATVLLVVGNTIRLSFESRREEVLVLKLLGATDAFVRRPFLYTGFWTGFLGGILACLGVVFFFVWMSPPAEELAHLYGSPIHLSGLDFETTVRLLATSTLLGIAGAWLAVTRLLRMMAP